MGRTYLIDVGIYLGDGSFSTTMGVVNLHPTEETHWVSCINQNFLDLNGCHAPDKLTNFIMKRNGICLWSGNIPQELGHKKTSVLLNFYL